MIRIILIILAIMFFWPQISTWVVTPFIANMEQIRDQRPHDFEICAPFTERPVGLLDCVSENLAVNQ